MGVVVMLWVSGLNLSLREVPNPLVHLRQFHPTPCGQLVSGNHSGLLSIVIMCTFPLLLVVPDLQV